MRAATDTVEQPKFDVHRTEPHPAKWLVEKIIEKIIEKNCVVHYRYAGEPPAQAVDLAAHNGYDAFHRSLDARVEVWLIGNPKATSLDFETMLRELYNTPGLRNRFPKGL